MSAAPKRLDEDPWLETVAQVLGGYFVGLLLFLIAGAIQVDADVLAPIDDIHD